LGIFSIRLVLAFPFRSDLRRISDPQLNLQLRQQSLKPARMPTGFHAHTDLHPLGRQITVELLRFLTMLQPSFL
jgi:hypothetical protein